MLFKPDEVANLKKGSKVLVEIKEGDVRVLKRNYCGVYELYNMNNPYISEYFEDLNLFKNRYGSVHKKFPLYNLSRQRLDIYPAAERMELNEMMKWFSDYGKILYIKSAKVGTLTIEYYRWISDMENTVSNFQIVKDGDEFTLNIAVRNSSERMEMVG
ncbi:hypothetical protein [Fonticella tunisiensis]|uniref:Uncharacterized protein n=1 Tax=Fonticella tunisiensis TaxID=1096341 RepID=A0A4R7KA81_9CLOT|nr:hypothetical protein [Fonticella tunisiensis]TDT50563.1 hypothetical protein EDD71_12728 [Fonticella tunisiensis]